MLFQFPRKASLLVAAVLAAGALDSASAQPPPVFRSGVTLVTTDVIVRDGDGQFLPDLTLDDFTIYEDGQPQRIASLVLVHGGRVFNQLLPPPPVPEGIILPGRTAPAASATPGRIFVIFIDDLHIRPPDTPLIHRVMDLLPETLIHEGDEFGIISSGKSAIRVQMTSDRNRLRAIDRAVGEAFDPRQLIERATQLSSLGEARWRAHVAFKTAIETVRGLEQIRHRRKAFLYVSAGYNFNPFDDSRVNARIESMQQVGFFEGVDLPEFDEPALDQFATTDAFGEVFSDSELHNELLLLIDEANRANVSFYTIDVRGLTTIPDLDFDLRTTEWNEYIRKQHSSLRTLAELTGGIAVVNRNIRHWPWGSRLSPVLNCRSARRSPRSTPRRATTTCSASTRPTRTRRGGRASCGSRWRAKEPRSARERTTCCRFPTPARSRRPGRRPSPRRKHPGRHDGRWAAAARSVPEEVRDLHEDRAVGPAIPLREEAYRIQPILLLVVAVVAQVEHRPGVDAVGQQQVAVERPVERVVLQDVAQQQPLGELECAQVACYPAWCRCGRRSASHDLAAKLLRSEDRVQQQLQVVARGRVAVQKVVSARSTWMSNTSVLERGSSRRLSSTLSCDCNRETGRNQDGGQAAEAAAAEKRHPAVADRLAPGHAAEVAVRATRRLALMSKSTPWFHFQKSMPP